MKMNLTKELRKILQSPGYTAFTPINFGKCKYNEDFLRPGAFWVEKDHCELKHS